MCCFCCNLHRHQIHLISYGCVAFSLISTGLVFTVFAIFHKETQIGKIWLAGPTTMVVGMVLVGKVMIDWGPAMMHGRHGSVDSTFLENMHMGIPNGDSYKSPLPRTPIIMDRPDLRFNGDLAKLPRGSRLSLGNGAAPPLGPAAQRAMSFGGAQGAQARQTEWRRESERLGQLDEVADVHGLNGAIDCIVYGQFDDTPDRLSCRTGSQKTDSNESSSQWARIKRNESLSSSHKSNHTGHSTPMPPPLPPPLYAECNCTHQMGKGCTAAALAHDIRVSYGTMTEPPRTVPSPPQAAPEHRTIQRPSLTPLRSFPAPPPRSAHLYQGETFLINERSYFI